MLSPHFLFFLVLETPEVSDTTANDLRYLEEVADEVEEVKTRWERTFDARQHILKQKESIIKKFPCLRTQEGYKLVRSQVSVKASFLEVHFLIAALFYFHSSFLILIKFMTTDRTT